MIGMRSNRREAQRYFIRNGAYVLKDSDLIRMGPINNISLGGFAFDLFSFRNKHANYFKDKDLSIRLGNILIDHFAYKISYIIGFYAIRLGYMKKVSH